MRRPCWCGFGYENAPVFRHLWLGFFVVVQSHFDGRWWKGWSIELYRD